MNEVGGIKNMLRDVGFDFDDEIFGESTCREIRVEEAYEPKQCDSEWFMKFHVKNNQSERQIVMKYRGDLFFQKQKYSEALSMYQESLQCLSSNNTVLEWELTESMALCLLKQDKVDDALSLVEGMVHDNQEKESSYWYLLFQIYRAMGNTEGEIETLQRCATLHSWNVQFWFSLALAYEKASITCCKLSRDEDVTIVKRERIYGVKHNPAVENCTEVSLNGECQSQKGCYTGTKKCPCSSTENQIQCLTPAEPCCMGERQIRCHLGNVYFKGQVFPVSQSDKRVGLQDQSVTYLHKGCPDSLENDSVLALFSSNRKSLQKECARKRLKWRNHVLSFGSLVKTRFFLEKSIEASSSFAREKSSTLLREVNGKIATHVECGCAQLIDRVLEMLYSSVVASGQTQLDQERDDVKLKFSTESVTNSVEFEQKWFGDLLFYMDAI